MNNNGALVPFKVENSSSAKIDAMSLDEVEQFFHQCAQGMAEHILAMAHAVQRLQAEPLRMQRLCDLYGKPYVNLLKLVACEMVVPELVRRFYTKPKLLAVLGGFPKQEQEELANGKMVPLMVLGPTGKLEAAFRDPFNMDQKQYRQAFSRDPLPHIRDEAEQVAYYHRKLIKDAKPVPEKIGYLRIDKERGGAMVGRKWIPRADLVAAVRALQQ